MEGLVISAQPKDKQISLVKDVLHEKHQVHSAVLKARDSSRVRPVEAHLASHGQETASVPHPKYDTCLPRREARKRRRESESCGDCAELGGLRKLSLKGRVPHTTDGVQQSTHIISSSGALAACPPEFQGRHETRHICTRFKTQCPSTAKFAC